MERKLDVSVVVALKQHKKIQSISGAPATFSRHRTFTSCQGRSRPCPISPLVAEISGAQHINLRIVKFRNTQNKARRDKSPCTLLRITDD